MLLTPNLHAQPKTVKEKTEKITTITISTGDYPPGYSPTAYRNGYVLDIVRSAFKEEGIEVSYEFLPWGRSFSEMADGTYMASCCWFTSKKREENSMLSNPVDSNDKFVFYSLKKSKFDWSSYDDLKHLKIGAAIGYTYPEEFLAYTKEHGINLMLVAKDEQNIKKLQRGRIDIAIVGHLVGLELIKKVYPSKEHEFTYHKKPLREDPVFLMFTKNKSKKAEAENLLKKFNTGLARLKSTGKYKEILDSLERGRYNIKPEFRN